MDPQQRQEKVAARLAEAGYTLTPNEMVGGTPMVVAHTSAFRWRWMATRLHLLMYVQVVDTVTTDGLERLTAEALEHALAAKGTFRGFQVGVAAAPVMIGAQVDDGARRYAQHQIMRRYGAFAWPVAVEAASGEVFRHAGRPAIAALYTSWMRRQIDTATSND